MRRRPLLLLLLAALPLAGCLDPDSPPRGPDADRTLPPVSTPSAPAYGFALRVSAETADGPALAGAEVQAFRLDQDGKPLDGGVATKADGQGVVRFALREPALMAVRATSDGWTREGVVLDVGETIEADRRGVVVSERDVFLPLHRSELVLTAASSLSTAVVQPDADGSLQAPTAYAALVLPEGLESAYLGRLSSATVRVVWEETATASADLAAALAWEDQVWARGPSSGVAVLPGEREARLDWDWNGSYDRSPRGEVLQAAAVLGSAAVGDLPLSFEVVLRFTGRQPAGLPEVCHSMVACVPPLPPLAGSQGQPQGR